MKGTKAMIRKSSKIRYIYEGKKLNLNKIYGMNKKRRGRSKYLLSVNVEIEKDGIYIPAKIVCVRNKKNRKDWVPLSVGVLPSEKGGDANGHMAGSDPVYDTVDCISRSVLSDR